MLNKDYVYTYITHIHEQNKNRLNFMKTKKGQYLINRIDPKAIEDKYIYLPPAEREDPSKIKKKTATDHSRKTIRLIRVNIKNLARGRSEKKVAMLRQNKLLLSAREAMLILIWECPFLLDEKRCLNEKHTHTHTHKVDWIRIYVHQSIPGVDSFTIKSMTAF